jgi:hypothetical protein
MSVPDMTVAWVEIYGSIALKLFIVQRMAKQKDFIVQNCSVKKRLQTGKILHCRTTLWGI